MDGQKLNQDPSLGVIGLTDPSADMFAASRILHLLIVDSWAKEKCWIPSLAQFSSINSRSFTQDKGVLKVTGNLDLLLLDGVNVAVPLCTYAKLG